MLIIKAKFERSKSLKTKTNIVFSTTDELNPIRMAQLLKTQGYLAFNADQFKKEVEEAMRDTSIGITETGRSKSQIFRGVCFQYALARNIDPYEYYNSQMNRIIEHYREKL